MSETRETLEIPTWANGPDGSGNGGWSAGLLATHVPDAGFGVAVSSALGALIASFIGILVAHRLHVPSIAVTTAAIVPMVPGSAVFRGLLELVESDGTPQSLVLGVATLIGAGAIGIALAAGSSLGLFLGAPLRDTMESRVRSRGRIR